MYKIPDDSDIDVRTDGNDNGNVNPKSNHPKRKYNIDPS